MVFEPKSLIKKDGSFIIEKEVCAKAHTCLSTAVIKEFWEGFTFLSSRLCVNEVKELVFEVGKAARPVLSDGEYAINVEEGGFSVVGESESALVRGVMTLFDRIVPVEIDGVSRAEIKCFELSEKPLLENRMVHFCIFPETTLFELHRFVRFCGALKFTHIILEFWGMLKYDCMKELAWSMAYSKEEVAPIMREARELGMEIIPMFNQWGHASAGRVALGKHVVLDQNPTLQSYFSEDGWCWDISKPKVRELLRKIRDEITEICGEGSYFHIGCDEAYSFDFTEENMDYICGFVNEIADQMKAEGRRVIVWGDMFLYKYPHYNQRNRYDCNAPTPEVQEGMLRRLSRDVVIADWQYETPDYPVETSKVFLDAGFDCLLCPWDRGNNQMRSVFKTIHSAGLFGVLHTTWHTLAHGMPYVAMAAKGGYEDVANCSRALMRTPTAALLRKVLPCGGDYEKSGWARLQLENV